jgi:serine protease Do
MARKQGCGCLPFMLGALLLAVAWGTQDAVIPPLQVDQFDPRSPRRPMPQWGDEQFVIEDRPGGPADSMGTAFAVDRDGAWLTAEHVTHGCTRVGLEDGRFARPVARVLESREGDAAIVQANLASPDALPLADHVPQPGTPGYHMGFPAGAPTLVVSELIGSASARRGRSDSAQPILAWAERARLPAGDGTLSGISGGPVLSEDGHVIGVNSAATDRRGRILTTAPDAVVRLAVASRMIDERPVAYPIENIADASRRFVGWLDQGVIRRIFCNVDAPPGG